MADLTHKSAIVGYFRRAPVMIRFVDRDNLTVEDLGVLCGRNQAPIAINYLGLPFPSGVDHGRRCPTQTRPHVVRLLTPWRYGLS